MMYVYQYLMIILFLMKNTHANSIQIPMDYFYALNWVPVFFTVLVYASFFK
jgi:hypothetical protein